MVFQRHLLKNAYLSYSQLKFKISNCSGAHSQDAFLGEMGGKGRVLALWMLNPVEVVTRCPLQVPTWYYIVLLVSLFSQGLRN